MIDETITHPVIAARLAASHARSTETARVIAVALAWEALSDEYDADPFDAPAPGASQ